MRDERQMVVVGPGSSSRPVIRLFNALGQELGSIVWEHGSIVEWGWDADLHLVIVEETGKVRRGRRGRGRKLRREQRVSVCGGGEEGCVCV